MAKHCDVCNQDYADDLVACPHCAAAKKTQLTGRGEERATQLVTQRGERATQLAKLEEERVGEPSGLSPQPEATPADSAVRLGSSPPIEAVASDSAVGIAELTGNAGPAEPVGASGEELVRREEEGSTASEEPAAGVSPAMEESAVDGTRPEQPAASASDVALESLISEESPSRERTTEEQAVSEEEVSNLLADLGETSVPSTVADGSPQQDGSRAQSGEAAASAAETETEEAAEAVAPAEAKPAKPAKPRSNVLALAGTAVLGILIGAGGTVGVQALIGPGEKAKPVAPVNLPQAAKAAPTFETLAARVASGDWDEARNAGIEQIPGNSPKELVARGEYHLGTYLKNVGSKINPQDPALQQAIQDLQKAAEQNDPDALYDLALIKELAGQLTQARAEYAKAAQAFANDPVQKQRFESAIRRVDLKAATKASGAAQLPQPNDKENRTALLALCLIGLQQPQPQQQPIPPQQPQPPQPQQTEVKEAGFEFWEAARLAQQGKFSEALRTLDRAQKLHDQLRFTRLRKAQNPLSDPAEDIFLRCCDELKNYWQLEERLRESGYLSDKNTPSEALQTVLRKIQESTAAVKDLTDQLMAAHKGQKEAQAKAAELEKTIQKSTEENKKLTEALKAKEKAVEECDTALASAKKEAEKLRSDYTKHNLILTKIRDELVEAKLLGSNAQADLGEAVKKVIEVAKTQDPQGTIRRQRDEITQLSASLKERRPPEEMLPLWLVLLETERDRTDWARQAAQDAQRVLADPRATTVQKAKAQVVLGLALRNTEKFDEAKTLLQTARGAVDKGEWLARVEAALKDVSDPAAYFAAQAQSWYDRGRMEAALNVLARALKMLPQKEQGKLLAQRSLIELDAARAKAKGPLPPTEPLLIAARRDAEGAIQAGAAEGHYAAGRIAEELGQIDAAIASYRSALAAHGNQPDVQGSRYRIALARVLLLPRPDRPKPPAAPPTTTPKVGFEDRKNLILMLTLGLQAPLVPGEEAGQEEAEKLADEVLKAPAGTVPFSILAQALAIKGRWNQALQTYVEGVRALLPREYGDGLAYLIRNDPRLKRPDSLRTPNPLEAEKHFAAGLNFYFDRDYLNAEKEFLLTIENDSQDARFFYFLGLSRLAQNRRRDAYADFGQGALLERLNRPSSAAVSEALERVQGPTRLLVNAFRQNPER